MVQFRWIFSLLILLTASISSAQTNIPVGSWRSHFSYLSANAVEKVGTRIFAGAKQLYSFDLKSNEYETYTKVNGLSDVGINHLRYDTESNFLYIVYENGNIDLWEDGRVYNMPDLKNFNTTGSKRINSIYFRNGLAYFCTDFGIVVINPVRKEIKESYILQDNSSQVEVKGLTAKNDSFYVVSNKGIFRAATTSNALQNFATWENLDTHPYEFILNHNGKLFVASDTMLYEFTHTANFLYETNAAIKKMRSGENLFYICETDDNNRSLLIFDGNGAKQDQIFSVNPLDVFELSTTSVWVADYWRGLVHVYEREPIGMHPNGIYTNSVYNLNVLDNDVYACAGGEISWIFTFNSGGISRLRQNGDWSYYNRFVGTPALDSINDIMDVAYDKKNQIIYAASFHDGLWEYQEKTNTAINYKNTPYIQSYSGYRVAGLAMDEQQNLWMTNYGAPEQVVVKKADGSWQKFSLPFTASEKAASQIIIDDIGQKWIMAPRGIGVFVLNDNNTIDNKNDDQIKLLRAGASQGNLADNEIMCLAKDNDGKIWIGTIDGIAIVNCPESIFSAEGCDAELKIVKYDLDAGELFQREGVATIAVDGANNKWIGTSNGVWLISNDAEKILKRFTIDNSPLPSNEVNKIVVHPQTGEVFIATSGGLISYRGEATVGAESNTELLIFPNPVPSDYSGTIAIKGLVEQADVRITDVSGQLVYKTKAQGGQAVWNGKNYLGEKPRSGVYYVFVTNTDGTEAGVGKMVIHE